MTQEHCTCIRCIEADRSATYLAPTVPSQNVSAPPAALAPLKLDLGCGKAKKEGFQGVDRLKFAGVDVVCDLGAEKWPFADDSVEEANASHFVEHLKPAERVHFANELHRVLKKGGRCTIVVPHWGSCRAYGDPTHEWPPVTEFWPPYLDASWRAANAPHVDAASLGESAGPLAFRCDFACMQPGHAPNPSFATGRSPETVQFGIAHYREAVTDMVFTIIKK